MHPILLNIPLWGDTPVQIHTYGLTMVIAFVVALLIAIHRAKEKDIDTQVILDLGIYSIVCGIIGARLAFLLIDYTPDPTSVSPFLDYFKIWKGGLTFQGGLFLTLAVTIWYMKKYRLPVGRLADIFAPAVAIGIGIGRIGCFFNGCCWGKLCHADFPLGVTFPENSALHAHQSQMFRSMSADTIEYLRVLGYSFADFHLPLPVHPAQLYTTAGMFVIFVLLLIIDKYHRGVEGSLMLFFLLFYSAFRFCIELIRDDTNLWFASAYFPGLRLGQILALATFAAAIAIYLYLHTKAGQESG